MESPKEDLWIISLPGVSGSGSSHYVFLPVIVANLLVGNESRIETLQITVSGPELLFTASAVFAATGAPVSLTVNGDEKFMWSRVLIEASQKLKIGKVEIGGCRCYLAVRGGFPQMQSHQSFTLNIVLT